MNAALPVRPPELDAHPLARAALRVEPRLSDLIGFAELDVQLRRYVSALHQSAERESIAGKDVVT